MDYTEHRNYFLNTRHTYFHNNSNGSVKIKAGDEFKQNFSTDNPLSFKVLSVDRDKNTLVVDVYSQQGYSHQETWDDLDVTEMAFENGDYKMITALN